MAQKKRTLFITGVSTGLGQALAVEALGQGHKVVGTVRKEADRKAFEAHNSGQATAVLLDVRDESKIAGVVRQVEESVGPIDVLVNNAGFGVEGVLEESPMQVLRDQFEVNVFGAVAVIQAVLPFMRKRRAGHILNITSMGGTITMPGLSYYHGTKFALEGISESLGKEVRPLGIHVTAVAPGSFRTDWAGRSMLRVERTIADYDDVFGPVRARRQAYSGKQAGDPVAAAKAMLAILDVPAPPVHLLLGSDAVRLVGEKLDALREEITAWERLSLSTDFKA